MHTSDVNLYEDSAGFGHTNAVVSKTGGLHDYKHDLGKGQITMRNPHSNTSHVLIDVLIDSTCPHVEHLHLAEHAGCRCCPIRPDRNHTHLNPSLD